MLFYLCKGLPDCTLDFELVQSSIWERLQRYFLQSHLQHDTEDFNYYDRISHLLLCIIAIKYPHFKDYFINEEIKLFQQRLNTMNCAKMKRELSEALECLSDLMQSEDYRKLKLVWPNQFQLVQSIIMAILSKGDHSLKRSHLKTCRKYKLTLPFTFPLRLVAKRAVEVRGGKDLMKDIFESEDDRLRQIIKRCRQFLSGSLREKNGVVWARDVDGHSLYFPPCMAGLHQSLRRSHRLSYDSRFQYTLFLKDIGLTADENVLFWESEYRKPREGSSCCHDWREKGSRYKYQIKHLYGLVGTQGLISSHSCDKFIQRLQPKMDGGCPFQHLTSEELASALPKSVMALPDVEDIFTYKNRGMPQRACAEYLGRLQRVLRGHKKGLFGGEMNVQKLFLVISPLQFYCAAKNL